MFTGVRAKRLFAFILSLTVVSTAFSQSAIAVTSSASATAHTKKQPVKQSTSDNRKKSKTATEAAAQTQEKFEAAPITSWINPRYEPQIALLCIHGLGLHSGSYNEFAMYMARHNIATYAIDVRGFGSWMKANGHSRVDFETCLSDVKTALTSIRQAHPHLPVFLLGESMGGAIALRAASMYPHLMDGLISSVPAGERFRQGKTEFKVAMQYLKGANKEFNIGSSIVNQATANPKVRELWANDSLDRMNLSPKELMQFQDFMNDNHDAAKKISTEPVLMVQGTLDTLVKPEGTWELFNELGTPNKYFVAVPSEHLIFEQGYRKGNKDILFNKRAAKMVANWMSMVVVDDNPAAKNTLVAKKAVSFVSEDLNSGIDKLVEGDYQSALALIQRSVEAHPSDSEARYWLGIAYAKLRRNEEARESMLKAIALGRDSVGVENKINSAEPAANQQGSAPTGAELAKGKPTVVAFCADWCDQCEPLERLFDQARGMFGEEVKLVNLDVQDQSNERLVKAFKVNLVPTVLYLAPDGQIASTSIGRTSFINFANGIRGLLR